MNMQSKIRWCCILVLFPFVLFGFEQKAELVLGLPEGADLRYGMEWKYGGFSLTPGLVFLTVTKIRDDDIIPVMWNPTLSFYKTFIINRYFEIVPDISAMYMYGYGGMLAQSTCIDCSGETRIRTD